MITLKKLISAVCKLCSWREVIIILIMSLGHCSLLTSLKLFWCVIIYSPPNRSIHNKGTQTIYPFQKHMANICPLWLHQNCTPQFLIPKTKQLFPIPHVHTAFDPNVRPIWSWSLLPSIILWRESETLSTAFALKWMSVKEFGKQVPFPKPVYLRPFEEDLHLSRSIEYKLLERCEQVIWHLGVANGLSKT